MHDAHAGPFFRYGAEEIAHLSGKDKLLGEAIERIGRIERRVSPDVYVALVEAIIGQQISNKAADTVTRRFRERFAMVPSAIAEADVAEIQKCGMSMRKAGYISAISNAVASGEIDLEALPGLADDEITRLLIRQPGIGVWTAEMIMIFSLGRPDVLSWDDLAIRRGMMRLYRHRELSRAQFDRYRRRYSPYGSVASLYLWAISAE